MKGGLQRRWVIIIRQAEIEPRAVECSWCKDSGNECGKCDGDSVINKHLTFHDLQRTYICRLIRASVELATVQKMAGHADIQTTLRYYHWVWDEDQEQAVAKLEALAG